MLSRLPVGLAEESVHVRRKWGAGLFVVAVAAVAVGAGGIAFKATSDDLSRARSEIRALNAELDRAHDERLSTLLEADERYRDLKKELSSRVATARQRGRKLEDLLDEALCFEDRYPLRDGFFRGSLRGDVDGDGTADVVRALARPSPRGPCRFLLMVRTDDGVFVARVHGGEYELENYFDVVMLVDINGVAGHEIVVEVGRGAYAQIAQIFTFSPGHLTRIRGFGSRDVWISGASTGNGAVFACIDPEGGRVVRTVWQYAGDGTRHEIIRRFYRVEGTVATLYFKERRVMALEKAFQRLPELSNAKNTNDGLGSCPAIQERPFA
jgi:hypothetical protein